MAYQKVYQQSASEGKNAAELRSASRTGASGATCALRLSTGESPVTTEVWLGLGFRLQADLAVLHFNRVFHGLAAVLLPDLISFLLNKRREALDVSSH
jgi:hypothetical protein